MADDRIQKDRPSLSRQLMPAVHGLLARPLSSYYLLIASSGLLLLIGLTMVFSATSVEAFAKNGNAFSEISSQAVFALLGLVAFWVCQRLPAQTLRTLGKYVMGTAIVLLTILAVLHALKSAGIAKSGLGPIKSDLNWLLIGPVQMQPGEIAKVGMVLWGADVIARKGPKLGHWRELAMPLFPVIGLLFVLVGYNDLGTMLVLLSLIVGLLWAAGVRMRFFAALGVLGLAGVGLLIAAASRGAGSGAAGASNYRLERLTSFLTPLNECDIDKACYQIIQGRSAIFEGGWFGVGLGKGALKWGWVPEAENDFIFSIVAEELGVVGCAVVLALLSVLAYTGFRIARRSQDPFRRLAASAITTWLVAQAVINMGGVVGLLPITGLPLPFISAGGTALVVTLAAIGMLASFARAEPDAARALNARPTPRWVRLVWAPLPPLPPPRRTGSARPPTQKKPVVAGEGRRR
jgi:cell division protein FtsW